MGRKKLAEPKRVVSLRIRESTWQRIKNSGEALPSSVMAVMIEAKFSPPHPDDLASRTRTILGDLPQTARPDPGIPEKVGTPSPCTHPKEKRRNLGYMMVCACGKRLR